GAKLVLLDKEIIEKAKEISKKIEYIELSSNSEFNKYFVEFMYF
ncbi:MAG: ASKHA domain-containing protein, partial [Dictyoglomus sp.]